MRQRWTLAIMLLTLAASGCTDAPRTTTLSQAPKFNVVLGGATGSEQADPTSDLNRMTNEEIGVFIQHIVLCWHTTNRHPQGVFDLALTINPDRTIADAQIVRPKDADSDQAAYRLADETVAELRTDPCSPLRLPPEKYTVWRQMTLTMDFRSPPIGR